MGAGNHHELIPKVVKIKAGGAVNFIISGLHNVIVYDDGTRSREIDTLRWSFRKDQEEGLSMTLLIEFTGEWIRIPRSFHSRRVTESK